MASAGSDPGGALTLAEILTADERLLMDGRPSARADPVARRAISFGVGAPWPQAVAERADLEEFEIARRTTGGSGLVHLPGDLAWSIVLPRGDPTLGSGFVRAYGRLGRGAARFLGELGLDGRWIEPPGTIPGYCTLSRRGQVLAVEGRIVGGAAQHATREAVLHQGIISISIDRPMIARLFGVTDLPLLDRLAGLRELGVEDPSASLAVRLRRATAESLAAEPERD